MNMREILAANEGNTRHERLYVGGLARDWLISRFPGRRLTTSGRMPILVGLDSWSPDERHGGPVVNGLDAVCSQWGLTGVYPFPYPQWHGLWRGWNTKGGPLRSSRQYDDMDFLQKLLEVLAGRFGEIEVYVAGFSDAGMIAQILDLRFPGLVAGVISVNGTIDPALPLPTAGGRILAIHGGQNPILPYEGGVGAGLKARLRCWALGGKRAWGSMPSVQVRRYAEANGVLDNPLVTDDPAGVFRHTRYGSPESGPIVEILVHTGRLQWYGRKLGGDNESLFSRGNTGPTPPDFSINDWVVKEFGFDKFRSVN